MLFGSDRTALRRTFAQAWQRHLARAPLEPLQARIVQVVQAHPEYQAVIEDPESVDRDYLPDAGGTNPYLHMAMHIALLEQRATDRPPGITRALDIAARRLGDGHAAEHEAMECLGRVMWEAQREATTPDEMAYLACVKRIARRGRR